MFNLITRNSQFRISAVLMTLVTLLLLLVAMTFVQATTETFRLTATDADANDLFSASLAISGSTVVIGAYQNDDDGSDSGSVYIFDCSNGCVQTDKLTASDAAMNDRFGFSVAISGPVVAVGAYYDDDGGRDSGSVYIFDCADLTACVQTDKLVASDAEADDYFGYSVAVSGSIVVVGVYNYEGDASDLGGAYVFDCSDLTACVQTDKLLASDTKASDLFGFSVAISGDMVIAGAFGDDDYGRFSGSAYVFDCANLGACIETDKLTASDATANDYFGFSVAISGNVAVVGAYGVSDSGSCSGSAYVFDCSSLGACNETSKLTASDTAMNDWFGYSVAVSGSTVVAGAYRNDSAGDDNIGAAYVFDCSSGACVQTDKLTASDAMASDYLGRAVAISGGAVVAGTNMNDDDGNNSGAAYVFMLIPPADGG